MRYWILLLTILSSTAFPKLGDHFKKALDKSPIHTMRNIDFIYMINLDQRPEKFAKCIEKLHPYGIYPYRFSAVNGWELTLKQINDVGVKFESGMRGDFWGTSYLDETFTPRHGIIKNQGQVYFCHCMSRGAIGCALSHLSVLQDALDSKYKTIWILEDDIELTQDPRIVSDLIDELDDAVGKDNWDILFTDRDTKNMEGEYSRCKGYSKSPNFKPSNSKKLREKENINSTFRRIGLRYGSYSMIIRRSGMKKILQHAKTYKIFLPYDMFYCLPEDMHIYTVRNDVVTTEARAVSDNGDPNYLRK